MSEQATILLPAAGVAFFVTDAALAQAAQKLAEDWRFARVAVRIVTGDIETAITAFAQEASPELVIIETGDISEAFIGRLGALAGVCAQGTDAVIIGPENDVHLYRSLIGMGVRDYLVRPVADHDLTQVISKTILDKKGLSNSRLSVVIGSKGGVGATALAQSLALMAAEDFGQKTLLSDAAGSAGTLGVSYGIEGAASLAEAIRIAESGSEDDMRRLLQSVRENLTVLLTAGEAQLTDHINADGFEKLVQRLMLTYPLTVFDASGASRAVQKRMLAFAGHVTVVTAPLLPALRNARALLAEIKMVRGGLTDVELVLNMQGMAAGDEVPAKDIKAALALEPTLTVTYQPRLYAQSESGGQPAVAMKNGGDLRRLLTPLVSRLTGGAPAAAAKGGDKGRMSLFKKIIKK